MNICMGSTDIPLNNMGIAQAELAAQLLKAEPIDHIVTSPLSRALQTAEIIAKVLNKPLTIIDDLKEYHAGAGEGNPNETREKRLERWRTGEVYEGAETVAGLESRAAGAITEALRLQESVLIVSHGIFYAALTRILGLPLTSITNCAAFYHEPPAKAGHPWQVTSLNEKIDTLYE